MPERTHELLTKSVGGPQGNLAGDTMPRMSLRLRRVLTACLAASALVLKAAVPLLAAAAAQLQGVSVARVCSLYGVAIMQMVRAEHAGHAHHHTSTDAGQDGESRSAADHGRDHCALTAVVAIAVGPSAAPPVASSDVAISLSRLGGTLPVADACALWVARLGHGPPAFA